MLMICRFCGGELKDTENEEKAQCINCGRVYKKRSKLHYERVKVAIKIRELIKQDRRKEAVDLLKENNMTVLELINMLRYYDNKSKAKRLP